MMAGDDQLIQGLLYDAAATRGALANWMKANVDGTMNASRSRRYVLGVRYVYAPLEYILNLLIIKEVG